MTNFPNPSLESACKTSVEPQDTTDYKAKFVSLQTEYNRVCGLLGARTKQKDELATQLGKLTSWRGIFKLLAKNLNLRLR